MKKLGLLAFMCVFNLHVLFPQQQAKHKFTENTGVEVFSVGVATTVETAATMLDSLKSLCRNDYSLDIDCSIWDLASKDTILEILRVESTKRSYTKGDYVINLSNALPFGIYKELVDSCLPGFNQGSYRNRLVPQEVIGGAINVVFIPLAKNQVPNDRQAEYFELYRQLSIYLMKFGSYDRFCRKLFIENCINDEVYNTVIDRLKNHPKYPERYRQEFFEKEAEKYNPALYDSTGVPQRIRNKEDLQNLWKWSDEDKEYWRRWNSFLAIDTQAKELGMTHEEFFYERQIGEGREQFGLVGYYSFYCVFDYVMKSNDQHLFGVCREFLEEHPDYKRYPEGCRKFFGLE
ncbi:MAG: hypothetical protein QM786_06760 [Breznakibacter sp.]